MKLKLIGKVGIQSENIIRYHGRRGHPIIHETLAYYGTKRRYIMVRKKGGGVKRLYEGSEYKED